MNWDRAKTILIILFLVINVFLILTLMNSTKYSNTISDSTIDETVTVLKSHGIDVKKSGIPTKRYQNKNLNVVNLLSESKNWANRFLGEGYTAVRQDMDNFEFEYKNQNKSVKVKDNRFTYEVAKEPKEFSQLELESARAATLSKLQKLMDASSDVYIISEGFEDNLYHLTVGAKYENLKIIGVNIRIIADKEDIIKVEGNWFVPGETEVVSNEKLMDVTSVLIHLLYTKKISITGIEKVETAYYLAEEYVKNKVVSAIPVYLVTDTNQKYYVFDARSGELMD